MRPFYLTGRRLGRGGEKKEEEEQEGEKTKGQEEEGKEEKV